ncbi:unnamed protein product [Ceutorhynchus assimilis]|uniref:MoaB/Mog domain-containing protein n=1 Tax=Ceutorhynchus assimilis TaxID=467358 RepID=A0A9P0GJB4_9CUCU|nr:unnamed protein product [Ceutorhynchus assimilis]
MLYYLCFLTLSKNLSRQVPTCFYIVPQIGRVFRLINRQVCDIKKCSSQKDRKITSAGIVVIGDEILRGQVQDTNSAFLATELHKLGIELKKITVIPDNVNTICEEVKDFSKKYNYVLTTGGIGPTHDDVTYEGVALAFNETLHLHPDLKEICSHFYKTQDPNGVGMKLAHVPKSSKLNYKTKSGSKLNYPNVSIHNVYMFPGIPELLKKSMLEAGSVLFKSDKKFFSRHFYCNLPEHEIVTELQQVVNEFPDVQFGCYPKMFDSFYKAKVTLESCCEESTRKAYARLMELVPSNSVVNVDTKDH